MNAKAVVFFILGAVVVISWLTALNTIGMTPMNWFFGSLMTLCYIGAFLVFKPWIKDK